MTTPLCTDQDPTWWEPGHEQARLAILICRRCPGCPDTDPAPAGVIRQGVPYFDSGLPMPLCMGCERPQVSFQGGWQAGYCPTCRVPDVPLPALQPVRASRRNHALALVRRGFNDVAAGEESGLSTSYVAKLRHEAGLLKRKARAA